MADSFGDRLAHAWNALAGRDPDPADIPAYSYGLSSGIRPDRVRLNLANEKSTLASVFTRISLDIANLDVRHIRLDDNGRYIETISSGLNYCLTSEANIDQTARHFKQDIVLSLFDKGVIAIVPVDTTMNPTSPGSWDITTMRVGEIIEWMPKHVRIKLYNDQTGLIQEVTLPKKMLAIVENPLYGVMNEPNSTLKRLINKLNLLDAIDAQAGTGKLDLIIQLPYVIKTEARREQAEARRRDIEMQLQGSKFGIAYTDGTEKITQLNRPAENTLPQQIADLKKDLYSQLGVTAEVFDGTADEKMMLNYYNRTIEPVLGAIVDEMKRKFLTKTARTQKQDIQFFRDPFKLVPINQMAEIADKFTRNEILSSNEIRGIMGFKPSSSPRADELSNKNMPGAGMDPAAMEDPNAGMEDPYGGAEDPYAEGGYEEDPYASAQNPEY